MPKPKTRAELEKELEFHIQVEMGLSRQLEQANKRLDACKNALWLIQETDEASTAGRQAAKCLASLSNIRVRDRSKK